MPWLVAALRRNPTGLAASTLTAAWLAVALGSMLAELQPETSSERCGDPVEISGQAGAELQLEYVQDNPNADEDMAVSPFTRNEGKIRECYRDALPDRVDPDKDQGRIDLLVMVGADGYPSSIRVHGLNESLEVYRECFVRAMARSNYGEPYGYPAAVMGRYRLTLPDDAPQKRRPDPPVRNRVYPRVIGRTPDDGDMAQLFVLVRLRQVEHCYDEFLETKRVSGSVELRVRRTRRNEITLRAKASRRALRPVAKCISNVAKTWPTKDVVRRYEPLNVGALPHPTPAILERVRVSHRRDRSGRDRGLDGRVPRGG